MGPLRLRRFPPPGVYPADPLRLQQAQLGVDAGPITSHDLPLHLLYHAGLHLQHVDIQHRYEEYRVS